MRTLRDGRRSLDAASARGPDSSSKRKPSNPTRCCSFSCPFPDRARSTTLATSALDAVDDFLSATCACHVLSADLRVNFHPRDASATSRPVFRAQGSMTSWILTDAVSAARVSSFSKVARRSGLQHVHVPRSLSRDNQIGRSPHTTQSRGLREFS